MDNDSSWKNLDNNRQYRALKVKNKSIVIIRPKDLEEDNKQHIPLFCPLCEFPITTSEDVNTLRDNNKKMCYHCDLWFKSNIESLDEIKKTERWKEYYKQKLSAYKPIVRLK